MKIFKCRICNSKQLSKLFSLGNMSFTGKFPKSAKTNVPKDDLNLAICKNCKLVQLDRSFNPKYLYSKDYGYRTGINKTMTMHVKSVVNAALTLVKPIEKDYVLDVASNDATLLNFYNKKFTTVGVDPLVKKHKKFYNKVNYKLSNFFSYDLLKKNKLNKKYKIITVLSMFYDLQDPKNFIKDIFKVLHKDGVFILEHADLLSIIKNYLFNDKNKIYFVFINETLKAPFNIYIKQNNINIHYLNNNIVFDFKQIVIDNYPLIQINSDYICYIKSKLTNPINSIIELEKVNSNLVEYYKTSDILI